MDSENAAIIRLFSIPPNQRSPADVAYLHAFLRTIEGLNVPGPTLAHRDADLRDLCRIGVHRRVPEDVLLYRAGEQCDCWYILLTGSVLIETSMFLPRACFGLRINGNPYRSSDCLVLEPSDIVMFRYLERENVPHRSVDTHRQTASHSKRRLSFGSCPGPPDAVIPTSAMKPPATNHQNAVTATILTSSPNPKAQLHPSSYGVSPSVQSKSSSLQQHYQNQSQLSETSSLSSSGCGGLADSGRGGSSFLTSTNGGGTGSTASSITSVGRRDPSTASGLTWSKTGTTGNDSSLLDSDEDDEEEEEEEDDFESSSHESLRDAFWESILKEPGDRTEEDIQILMDNVQQLPAFSNLTKATCRALCSIMLVAVVHEAGQVVLTEDEKLDTWSVVLNGTVEVIEPDGTIRELTRGDAFGVRLDRPDRVLHRGTMRTVTEDCQFVWVPQADYMQIMSREGEAEIPEVEEGGRVVLVYETLDPSVGTGRTGSNGGTAVAPNRSLAPTKTVGLVDKLPRVVTKGTPEKLIEHLIADLSNLDITYPEDFLLTYRTFLDSPRPIVDRLLSWHLHSPKLRARVNRIILLWVHNHFNDFEDSVEMMRFVEKFDEILSKDGTAGERRLFQLACSTKARVRHVEFDLPPVCAGSSPTLTKLPFTLIGGQDGWGIFINQVDPRFLVSMGSVSYPSNGSASCIHQSQTSLTSIASLSVNPSSRSHLRRADQLLTVNGRSVEHMTPHEVIQLIQSGRALSNSTTTTPNSSTTTDQYGSAVTGVSGEAGCTAVNSSATTCTIHLLVVFNPVQYHQLISTLDYSLSMESDQGTSSQTTHPDGPRKITLPKSSSISAGLGSGHALNASPVPTAYQRGRVPGNLPRRLPSQDRGSSVVSIHPTLSGTPGSIRPDPTRPRSAQNSPTRSSDTGPSKACSRERPGAFPIGRSGTIAAGDEPKFSVSPTRLNVHPTHRPQRSSSQPDLLTLDVLAGSSVNGTCGPLPPVSHVTSDGLPYTAVSGPSGRDSNCSSVIRVWRAADAGRDQTSKLVLLPRKQTTALEATRLALEEFGLPEDDLDSYCLYHVTVEPGPILKQSRLANITDDLPGRLTLNARYYLKHNRYHDPLVADDVARNILTDSRVTFMQLTPEDLAARLTLDDYEVFRAVQSTEYIDEVFGLTASASEVCLATAENGVTTAPPSPPTGYATGHENLDRFTELVNREAYWAPTEICNETNLNKRVDLLKRFIKLAKFCRELRNFNTMFCILVGLHQTPVERLKQTWERLPNKYQKLYRDLSMILDTSRNFFQYRTLLTADDATAPMLPYLPLVLKDLTFIHLGNPSRTTDGLINFVKLRMLAKEIRAICRMCNVDYDLAAAQRLIRRSAMSRATRGWTSSGKSPGNSSAAVGSGSASAAPSSSASSAPSNVVTGPSAQPQLTIKGVVAAVNGWDAITNSNNSDPVVASGGGGSGGAVRDSSPGPGQAIRNPNGGGSGGGGGGPFARRRSAGFPLISGFSSSHAAPANPKKLYDAWLTALRIRTYLANLNVVRDSDMLSQMSSRLEPGMVRESRSSLVSSVTPVSVSASASTVGSTGAVSGWTADQPISPGSNQASASTTTTPNNDVKSPIKSPPPVSPTLASTTTAQSLLPTTTPTPTATSSTASSVTACASNSNPTSMKMTASPNARLSNTATTSAPSTNQSLVRPILGAQSVEDARKLLALSEYQKRQRHHRMPAFTFPASRPTQFVFVAPPPTGQTTHTGVGLGQLQYAHPVQRSSSQPHGSDMSWSTCPAYASAGPAVCPAHPALATATMPSVPGRPVQQACCYTLVGSKTLLLDNLIPMPQRIGPNVPMRSSTGTPVQFMNQQQQQQRQMTHYAVPNAHSYPHAQTGQHSQQGQRGQPGRSLGVNLQTQQQSQYAKHPHQHLPVLQQMRLNSQTRQSTERKTAPQPAPLQQQQQQHVSNPAQSVLTSSHGSAIFSTSGTTGTIVATRAAPVPTGLRGPAAPPPPTPHPAVLTQFVVNGSQKIPSGRTAGRPTDDTYHYPTANTHPLGLSSAQIQHNKQINAHRIGQQQQVDWKPNRPPPYELALALRQMQPTGQSVSDQCNNFRAASHSRRPPVHSREQPLSGSDQPQPAGHVIERLNRRGAPPVSANPAASVTTVVPVPHNHQQPQQQQQQQQQQQMHHHHPPGAPRPGPDVPQMEPGGGSKSTGSNSGSGRFLQPRPAPPSYQQVVSLTRYGQQQQQQRQAPMAIQERPLPPQRTSTALSNPNSRQLTNPNGISILRPNVTTVSASEPRLA